MFDDLENFNDDFDFNQDKAIDNALEKYREMTSEGKFHFLDSEEYEMVVDYFISENSLTNAEKAINEALAQFPQEKVAFQLRRAICYASSNQEQKALDILSEIETLEPENADILLTKGAIYSQLQSYEKAIEEYKKALKDYDELDEVFYSIAQEYQNLGQTDKAIDYLKKSLQANAGNESALFELSMVYELSDRSDDGAEFFKTFADNNPMNHIAWFCLGMSFSNIGMYEKAIVAFDYSIVLDEHFLSAYLNKSNAQNSLALFSEAIETYNEALSIDPDNSYILYCIGENYLDLCEYDLAEKFLLKSIAISDVLSEVWVSLAAVYEEKSWFDQAITSLQKAISLDPENVDYYAYLARLYHITDQVELAISHYDTALKMLPENIDSWFDLAELYYNELEDPKTATAVLEQCMIKNPQGENEVLTRMAIYCFLSGDEQSAELLLLSIPIISFDFLAHISKYDKTLFDNASFCAMIERIQND